MKYHINYHVQDVIEAKSEKEAINKFWKDQENADFSDHGEIHSEDECREDMSEDIQEFEDCPFKPEDNEEDNE
jgi:hypothetical protein